MAGVFIICFVIFPIAVFINSHKVFSINEFLDKQDSDVIKGIATSFVILAHLTSYLESTGESYNEILKIFTVMGGMGVLLFFFLSGYGLYKGYKGKKIEILFWKKRLINMYFPCVVIQFIFYMIEALEKCELNIWKIAVGSLFGAWFIDVILIQYFIFYVTEIISKGRSKLWILFSFLISIIVALAFWKLKFNARWYNGLILFPFGMLIAYSEKKIIVLIKKQWSLYFILSILLFVMSGVVFTTYKGKVVWIDVVKTFSGMCLSMMVCIGYLCIKLCSKIMRYMGKRSLYFYLVHINMIDVLTSNERLNAINVFYLVILLTFLVVEIFYRFITDCGVLMRKRQQSV